MNASPRRRPARPLLIVPAAIAQVILFGLSIVSTGALGLVLWAGGRQRFDTLSQQPLRRSLDWTGLEPSYGWALVFGSLTLALLACIAFQAWPGVTVVLCIAPVPFAWWSMTGVLAALNEPKATMTGIAAYATLAALQVALAVVWIVLRRLNPDGVALRSTTSAAVVVDDPSSRHPVALALYAGMVLLGAALGPLGPGSASLVDALDESLRWQWSVEAIVGGLLALVGAAAPLSRRLPPGLILERAADVCLMFACVTYGGALLYRSGVGALGPAIIFAVIAIGFTLRAAQITVRVHKVIKAANDLPAAR